MTFMTSEFEIVPVEFTISNQDILGVKIETAALFFCRRIGDNFNENSTDVLKEKLTARSFCGPISYFSSRIDTQRKNPGHSDVIYVVFFFFLSGKIENAKSAWLHARPLEGFLFRAASRKAVQRIVPGMWSSRGLSSLAV